MFLFVVCQFLGHPFLLDINAYDDGNGTALTLAILSKHADLAKMILLADPRNYESKIDVNVRFFTCSHSVLDLLALMTSEVPISYHSNDMSSTDDASSTEGKFDVVSICELFLILFENHANFKAPVEEKQWVTSEYLQESKNAFVRQFWIEVNKEQRVGLRWDQFAKRLYDKILQIDPSDTRNV